MGCDCCGPRDEKGKLKDAIGTEMVKLKKDTEGDLSPERKISNDREPESEDNIPPTINTNATDMMQSETSERTDPDVSLFKIPKADHPSMVETRA